jgi:hypothetical protein
VLGIRRTGAVIGPGAPVVSAAVKKLIRCAEPELNLIV